MRRDGRPFVSGGESPRPFSDAAGDRAFEPYVPPRQRLPGHAIDEAPPRDALLATPSPLAHCGFSNLKRR